MNTILDISAAGMVCGESPQLDSRSSARGTSSSHGPLETPAVVFLRDGGMAGRREAAGQAATGNPSTEAASPEVGFIVLYRGRYPVRIIGQVTGRVFALVGRAEATRFVSEDEARRLALAAGVAAENIFVQAVSTKPNDLKAPVRKAGGAGRE